MTEPSEALTELACCEEAMTERSEALTELACCEEAMSERSEALMELARCEDEDRRREMADLTKMNMAAIKDTEQENACCEIRILKEMLQEILNDLENFSFQHENMSSGTIYSNCPSRG